MEGIEHDHSRLLVCKAKADAEMYDDMELVKDSVKVLQGKMDYVLHVLDDSGSEEDSDEAEEEKRSPRDRAPSSETEEDASS